MSPDQASAVVLAAFEGTALSSEEQRCFQDYPPAGFTLFRRNLSSAFVQIGQMCAHLQSLRKISSPPFLIAIDQEGGRVARLKQPFPDAGPAWHLAGTHSDPDALQVIENHAFIVGSSLKGLGINANFAPVLDILTNPENLAIGDRCFGDQANSVSLRAHAYMRGLQASGVLACLKHFPGQGEAGADTHAEATIIEASLETLMKRELQPYLAMMHECPMIMVSHAIYPALDAVYPASLSKHIMQDFLRQKLQYQGLVVTDDMNMKAIAQDKETWTTAVLNSVAAGADLVLVCRDLDRYRWAIEALARESERSPAFQNRLTDALQRLHSLRTRLSF